MANFRYNIDHDWRWQDGLCYSVVDYSVSYDPVKNESTVTFGQILTRVWGAEGTTSYETTTLTVKANDGGETASTTASASAYFWNYGFEVLSPRPNLSSVTVKHSDTAGVKSITISSTTGISHWENEYTSGSGSVTVETGEYYPASSLIVSNGTLGVLQTLEVDRVVDSFTHTITYSCGTASGTICTKSSDTSIEWTPPMSLASQNVHGTSVVVQFTITTYSGDTLLDTKSASITCAIPESVKPSFTVAVSDAMGYANNFGGYVQTKSKFNIVVDITTMYDATVTSVKVIANGETHNTSNITTGALKTSGNNTITVEVTDSRGRKVSGNTTVVVLAYSAPAISLFTYNRCDSDGTDNVLGDYAEITFSNEVTSLSGKNAISYTMEFKKTSEAEYATVNMADFAGVYSVISGTRIFPADAGSSYDVRLTVADSFGSAVASLVVDTGSAIMHWLPKGVGMAIGKIAEKIHTLELGWRIHMNGNRITGLGDPEEDFDAVSLKSLNTLVPTLVPVAHPVGSIYMSVNSTSPAELFGGTWEQLKDKFLLAAGDTYEAGATGGEATHKLTVKEMPSHKHTPNYSGHFYTTRGSTDSEIDGMAGGGMFAEGTAGGGIRREANTSSAGSGQAHNNMPPYLAVYVWQRIA